MDFPEGAPSLEVSRARLEVSLHMAGGEAE